MKKFTILIAAALSLDSVAFAGGDIQPVEPVVQTPTLEVNSAPKMRGFYIGIADSIIKEKDTYYIYSENESTIEYRGNEKTDDYAFMAQVGYQFNQYLSIEGRYWSGKEVDSYFSEDYYVDSSYSASQSANDLPMDFSSIGIYIKPTLPVTDDFNLYGLLGYSSTSLASTYDIAYDILDSEGGFSWGIGASVALTEKFSLFVDYVQLINNVDGYYERAPDDYIEWNVDSVNTINFGATYSF